MKLLALETWQYISIATAVAVALIVIICIIIWAVKKSKKNKKEEKNESVKASRNKENSVGSSESEGAYASRYGAEEERKPAKKEQAKPVQKTESKPAEKPAPKTETKPERDAGKVYHISKRKEDGKWQIKAEGGARAIKLFSTQAEAMEYGKQLAVNQGARIMLHKLDGSFRKLTY